MFSEVAMTAWHGIAWIRFSSWRNRHPQRAHRVSRESHQVLEVLTSLLGKQGRCWVVVGLVRGQR